MRVNKLEKILGVMGTASMLLAPTTGYSSELPSTMPSAKGYRLMGTTQFRSNGLKTKIYMYFNESNKKRPKQMFRAHTICEGKETKLPYVVSVMEYDVIVKKNGQKWKVLKDISYIDNPTDGKPDKGISNFKRNSKGGLEQFAPPCPDQ